jgi:nucleoside-diphosphate-sugar epimerase
MKILVTGATGLIGNLVARILKSDGHGVRILVRNRTKAEALRGTFDDIADGDLASPPTLHAAVRGVETIVHCAGLVGSGRGPAADYQALNVRGTESLLQAAKAAGVKRVVLLSSVAVYATGTFSGNVTEKLPRRRVGQAYVDSKIGQEEVVEGAGLPYVILRPYWVTGGGDRYLIPQVARLLRNGEFRYIGSKPRQWSFSVVENVSDAAALAATHPQAVDQIYNVTDITLPISDTVNLIADTMGVPRPTEHSSLVASGFRALMNQSESSKAHMGIDLFFPLWLGATISSEKLRRELGWTPRVNWQDSVRQGTLEWMQKQQ